MAAVLEPAAGHGTPAGAPRCAVHVSAVADDEAAPHVYKVLFVGAGIVGIYSLVNQTPEERAGSLMIDAHDSIGGLWARVPRWQTVQIDPIDFCTEGLTTRKAVWDADDVMHMLHTKVKLHGLEDNMLLGHRLDAMEWTGGDDDGHWVCGVTRVSDGAQLQVCARILFMATGKHAHPRAPAFPSDGSVQVLHSSELRDFETVRGRRVAVVGAGPSGLDILENSIKAGAKGQLEWIVRSPRHFFGVDLNKLAFVVPLQLLLGRWLSTVVMNAVMNLVMYARHALSGTLSWLPASPLNMRYEHPAPGRGFLLTQRRRVSRHVGKGAEVARVEGGAVVLKSGASVAVDMLVLATGYDLPTRPTGFQHPTNFAGCIPTGWHVGRMCLPAEGLLDSTGSAPMTAYLMYNTLRVMVKDPALLAHPPAHGMAAVGPCGRQQLFNCMEPLIHMAPLMRRELPFLTWRLRMAAVYLYYRVVHRTTVFFTDSLVWTGLNLDDLPRARGVGGGGGAAAAAAGGVKGGAGTGM